MHSLLLTEFLALNPKVYSINYQTMDEFNEMKVKNKNTLTGVSKTVVKKEITHKDYEDAMNTSKAIRKDVTSIRSFNHQIYTFKLSQVALTAFYDKMQMLGKINCVPYGYNPSNEIPETIPDADPDEGDDFTHDKRCYLTQCLVV